jgi:hypothetical protein
MSKDKAVQAIALLDECRAALMECDRDCDYALIERIDAFDSKPAPPGIEFEMMGPKLAFVVGNQCFTLDYEPDSDEEAEFMQRMLCHALSGFSPDVKTREVAAQPARAPASAEQVEDYRWNWLHGPAGVHPSAFVAGFRSAETHFGIGEAG